MAFTLALSAISSRFFIVFYQDITDFTETSINFFLSPSKMLQPTDAAKSVVSLAHTIFQKLTMMRQAYGITMLHSK